MNKVIFIGQAMPRRKRDPHDWPSLNVWLRSIDLSIEEIRQNFCFSALVDYFPGSSGGGHLVPSAEEIKRQRSRLARTITDFGPGLVVPVGKLSISYCLDRKIDSLSNYVGKFFEADPYRLLGYSLPVIPLPHPSGASAWRHTSENKKLLQQALNIFRRAIVS